jgi:hypothetical protein
LQAVRDTPKIAELFNPEIVFSTPSVDAAHCVTVAFTDKNVFEPAFSIPTREIKISILVIITYNSVTVKVLKPTAGCQIGLPSILRDNPRHRDDRAPPVFQKNSLKTPEMYSFRFQTAYFG